MHPPQTQTNLNVLLPRLKSRHVIQVVISQVSKSQVQISSTTFCGLKDMLWYQTQLLTITKVHCGYIPDKQVVSISCLIKHKKDQFLHFLPHNRHYLMISGTLLTGLCSKSPAFTCVQYIVHRCPHVSQSRALYTQNEDPHTRILLLVVKNSSVCLTRVQVSNLQQGQLLVNLCRDNGTGVSTTCI